MNTSLILLKRAILGSKNYKYFWLCRYKKFEWITNKISRAWKM